MKTSIISAIPILCAVAGAMATPAAQNSSDSNPLPETTGLTDVNTTVLDAKIAEPDIYNTPALSEKRWNDQLIYFPGGWTDCHPYIFRSDNAPTEGITEGIKQLRAKGPHALCVANSGKPGHYNKRSRCERVACSGDAGIFLCNDLDVQIRRPCSEVADYVENLVQNCRLQVNPGWGGEIDYVHGHKAGPTGSGFQVMVMDDSC
ncbi:hypothetical protein BKA67DRAFT_659933 [Truncatella angustata]|uniref:Uncharacterized protein n=1 Tax=Truncatella angustata TaxID=152316 RepID=A0A9P8UJD5_9PEZI|nr:uncharacterized protein BKA67DRAFT_659933 [Truncatella angustata]KAH6653305.1 hypothetical protein BKA67DRAFT_659933 [Truncatella angustata]KAH8195142.1 hypothetical protein TruAng_010694 [Truncatella angustata]